MKIDWVALVVLSLPPCLGMLCAFFAAKKEAEGKGDFKEISLSGGLIYGYMAGSLICIFSAVVLSIGSLFLAREPIVSLMVIVIYAVFFISIAVFFIGILLFIPCALFGFNIGARKRVEAEMARTQQQILKDVEVEKEAEND